MKFLLILFSSLLLISCDHSNNNFTPAKVEEEVVKATLVAMWDAIEKGDADRYAIYVHPDFTQFGEMDSLLLVGKEKEVNGIQEYTKVASNVHTEMIDPRVTVNGNVAWITYYWKDNGIKNGVAFASYGKSTRIFVKENGNWLCIHGHYTLLPVTR
ncbi:MAG: nuclear transport factor 2 family protein [Bacteroidota bacterium]